MEESSVALFHSAPARLKSNDVFYPFRQDSDFFYLTGFQEEECALLLEKNRSVLFLRPNEPEMEIWNGRRLGIERAPAELGVDMAFDISRLNSSLIEYLKNKNTFYHAYGRNPERDSFVFSLCEKLLKRGRAFESGPRKIVHPSLLLHEMRMIKSDEEILILHECAKISNEAHKSAISNSRPGMFEYELQALLEFEFKKYGGTDAYPSIVASGANACTLHYHENNRQFQDGELIMIDAAAEKNYLNTDVSRTFPVGRKFTAEQKDLYEMVLAVQRKAVSETVEGNTLDSIHENAVRGLTEGLIHFGILNGSPEENIEKGTYKKYYMHKTSHWLGMDVHDVGSYYDDKIPRKLKDGMVCTIEPGIYLPENDESLKVYHRGIGIRIEDDILVKGRSPVNLTGMIPKEVADIESLKAK